MTLQPIDREALRTKYREERDKRLRPDGNAQYVEPTGPFAHLVDDPFTPRVERKPCFDEVTVAFIGGGFAALCTGARLKQAGITDVRIIDGAGDVGGVWYWNRYPGAMCDTAAMVYLPLLEETGHTPTMKYVFAPEIFAHAQRIAKQFGLYENALLSTSVTRLEWDDAASRWVVHTDRGDRIRARFVAMGTGPLNRPKLPGIPGIETYGGHWFHTSRWDYPYTGGDPSGAPMTKLADKRVAIIGTGATAVQCIPPLGRDAKELFVFQRTPSSIDVRNNHPIDPAWFKALKPGWQQEWLTNFATLQTGGFADEDLVKDGWTDIAIRVRDRVVQDMGASGSILDMAAIQKAFEDSDDEKMTEIRARVDAIVKDPKTAAALKPWYRQLCKRPCFHDEYLQTYNRPNVHLVDTDGKGVERIDATGVWVAGVHYDVDCLVFASGFEFATDYSRRAGFETIGRGGRTLSADWADGMRTMHGMHVHGFPNLFIVGLGQNGNLISNITQNLDDAGKTIAAILRHALDVGAAEVEVTEAAENAWVDLIESSPQGFLGNPDCTPGYYNNEGGPIGRRERLNVGGYPLGPVAYFQYIDEWRRSGAFEGLTFRSEPAAAAAAS
ncbi:MAG TPA: NAD(P)/FAD-dependent oxidoreductase [Candidatus Eisenbacteria bacterium]|nr:NAD(P)/FAD-dependent oxidoreductase [Candidatus Eisenbacteria bacterium]